MKLAAAQSSPPSQASDTCSTLDKPADARASSLECALRQGRKEQLERPEIGASAAATKPPTTNAPAGVSTDCARPPPLLPCSIDHAAGPLTAASSPRAASLSFTHLTHVLKVELRWEALTYRVPIGWGRQRASKTVLHGVSGQAQPGQLLAVMGPTGACLGGIDLSTWIKICRAVATKHG